MPYVTDIKLTLTVHSDVLSPEQITEIAGIQPSDSHRIGDTFGRNLKGTRKSNYWAFWLRVDCDEEVAECTEWFSDGIIRLLERLPSEFVSRLTEMDSDLCAIVWVGLFGIQDQGAINIRSDVSKLLAEYNLDLVFDMYIDNNS